MDIPLEEQILNAIELFHYSYSFRESLFVIVLGDSKLLRDLLPDLRVFDTSQIQTMVITRDDKNLRTRLERWNVRGHNFEYFSLPITQVSREDLPSRAIHGSLKASEVPVLALEDPDRSLFTPSNFYTQALKAAHLLRAQKVFFPGPYRTLEVDGESLSHPSHKELETILASNAKTNIQKNFLEYLTTAQKQYGFELIVLQASAGTLFQEVFTHRGAGTLFSSDHPNIFRQARAKDVATIALLIKPYVKNNLVLPLSESEIYDSLKDFYVYTVNNQVVATAKLTEYGDSCEIGKICTLPRYQRKGRARAITEAIIARARELGKRSIFSLSTQERMWVFFRQLGFTEIPREKLPEAWQKQYDFSRASRAFVLELL